MEKNVAWIIGTYVALVNRDLGGEDPPLSGVCDADPP